MFIMGRTRRGFTPEYKDEAVKLVINTGRTVATVARELGLKEQTLGRWVHDFRARAVAGEAGQGGLSETERAELLRLRRENSDLKLDRAFLKKRRSSSPRKHRIRTASVRADAGGEEQLRGDTHGPTLGGVPVRAER
jgi:transposase